MIRLDARVQRGAFTARYRGTLGARTLLFGPSGSGKSTLLDLLAGLVDADGTCCIDSSRVLDTAAGVMVPPRRRGIGYAFQDDRLFPHLTVRQNLAFANRGDVLAVASALDLTPLLERRPDALSGGEKKRVAVGRAILAAERLLLLDEPFGPLDDDLADHVADLISDTAARVPTIVVSHDLDRVPLERVRIDALVEVKEAQRSSSGGRSRSVVRSA